MTCVEARAFAGSLDSPHFVGTPAARQMAAQIPCALKSGCADGSHTNPTSSVTSVSTTSEITLHCT